MSQASALGRPGHHHHHLHHTSFSLYSCVFVRMNMVVTSIAYFSMFFIHSCVIDWSCSRLRYDLLRQVRICCWSSVYTHELWRWVYEIILFESVLFALRVTRELCILHTLWQPGNQMENIHLPKESLANNGSHIYLPL
jgi:hypothetical protein